MSPATFVPGTIAAYNVGSAAENAGPPIDGEEWHSAFAEVGENAVFVENKQFDPRDAWCCSFGPFWEIRAWLVHLVCASLAQLVCSVLHT